MGELLKDRVALVTGAGKGIGKAIAMELAGEGAKIITNDWKPGAEGGDAETTARQIKNAGGHAIPVYADVARFDETQMLVQTAIDKFGQIDILVTCAGADGSLRESRVHPRFPFSLLSSRLSDG